MAFETNQKSFFQKTTLTKRPDEIWLNFEGMYQVATDFVNKLSFRTFICFDWSAMQKTLIWRMDEIKINWINYLEHILNDKPLASPHLILPVEPSQLCDTIKKLSEGLTPEEIFLLIVENVDSLIKIKQYEYAGMIACIAVKFLEENLCQPDVYLQFSLFSSMQYLFQANPLINYQYGEKLLNLLKGFKENPDLKAGAIKQFNSVLIDVMGYLHHHPDSFNEEHILALAQKVGENIEYLTAENQEYCDSDTVIELIANFSSQLLKTNHTETIINFIKNINENYFNNFTKIHLFYVIYLDIHQWLFETKTSAVNSLKEELTQVYFALKGKKVQPFIEAKEANHDFLIAQILELKTKKTVDLTNLNNACTTYKRIELVLERFYLIMKWSKNELDWAKNSDSAAGATVETLFKELSPILFMMNQFQQLSLGTLSAYLEEEIKKTRESVEKTSVSITSHSVPEKISPPEKKTGSKAKKRKKKSKRQKPKPLPENKSEPVVVKSKKKKNKKQELFVQAFAGEPELLAKYQDILKNSRLAYAGTGQNNKLGAQRRSRIKVLLDDASQKNNELIKEANAKNKPLIAAYAYITAIEIDQIACINLKIPAPTQSKEYIKKCEIILEVKKSYIEAIEVNFRQIQALCDGYYAITKKEKAILIELQSLVQILVSHWEKTIIEEAKWETYVANKAEFIEQEIENINREINKLDEGRKQALEDGKYLNNEKPTYKCAQKRYELKERMLQLQYLKQKTSSAALKDKADLNINHVPHSAPNLGSDSQEDDLGTQQLNTPHSIAPGDEGAKIIVQAHVPEDEYAKIVVQDHVPGDECAKIVVQDHVPGDECAKISRVPAVSVLSYSPGAKSAHPLGQTELTWLLSLEKKKENVSLTPPQERPSNHPSLKLAGLPPIEGDKPISTPKDSGCVSNPQNDNPVIHIPALGASSISTQEGSATDCNNALIHLVSTLADLYASIPSHPPVQKAPPLAVANAGKSPGENENQSTEVFPSNPTLQKKSLTFFQDSKPAKHFYDEPKVLTNMLSSYFELAIQFRLGLTLIEHKEHLIVVIYTNQVEDRLFLMDTPTLKDLRDIDLLTVSKKNGNVPILIKVKDSNQYFIFGRLGNNPWKTTRLWGEKSDIFIKLLDQKEETGLVNHKELSQDVLSALKKYHSFFVHFPKPKYSFLFDEKQVLQILNTRKLQTHPGEINIKRAGSLEASLLQLIYNIADKKGVPPPMISSNLNNNTRSEVTAPAYRR